MMEKRLRPAEGNLVQRMLVTLSLFQSPIIPSVYTFTTSQLYEQVWDVIERGTRRERRGTNMICTRHGTARHGTAWHGMETVATGSGGVGDAAPGQVEVGQRILM